MMLFAHHNIIKDPPFSHLDLVSCRNLLIYLNRGGAAAGHGESCTSRCNAGRLSVSRLVGIRRRVRRSVRRLSTRTRICFRAARSSTRLAHADSRAVGRRPRHARTADEPADRTRATRHDCLPPISTSGCSSSTRRRRSSSPRSTTSCTCRSAPARYLQYAGGEPSHDLLKAVRPELRIELRTALYQAAQQRRSVEARGLVLRARRPHRRRSI